jgi:hypothetical protein
VAPLFTAAAAPGDFSFPALCFAAAMAATASSSAIWCSTAGESSRGRRRYSKPRGRAAAAARHRRRGYRQDQHARPPS